MIIRYRFRLKMRLISLVQRIPCPFEMFKSPYFTKLSGKSRKTSWNSSFYHVVDIFYKLGKNALIERIIHSAP